MLLIRAGVKLKLAGLAFEIFFKISSLSCFILLFFIIVVIVRGQGASTRGADIIAIALNQVQTGLPLV